MRGTTWPMTLGSTTTPGRPPLSTAAAGQLALTWRGAVVECPDAEPTLSVPIELAALDHAGRGLLLRRDGIARIAAQTSRSRIGKLHPWNFAVTAWRARQLHRLGNRRERPMMPRPQFRLKSL